MRHPDRRAYWQSILSVGLHAQGVAAHALNLIIDPRDIPGALDAYMLAHSPRLTPEVAVDTLITDALDAHDRRRRHEDF